MKKLFSIFLLIFLMYSCSGNNNKNVIVYNIFSAPKSLDPHKFSDNISLQVSNSLYEGLMRYDKDGKLDLGMAKEYKKLDNTYTFVLKDGLKYSDGTSITIEDVYNGFLRVLDKKELSQYAKMLYVINNAKEYYEGKVSKEELGIKVIDGKLVFELNEDVPYFLSLLTLPLSAPYIENKFNGPYMIKETNEQDLLITKNPNYWRNEDVKIKNIKYVYFNDYSVVNNLIKNGDIDISRVDVELLGDNVNKYYDGRIWYIDYNLFSNSILKNLHMRKAISEGINRTEYIDVVKKDGSKIAKNLVSDILGYKMDYEIIDFDLDNAKNELEIAKKELNLENISLELLTGNTPIEIKEAQFIQNQLQTNLGIEVKIKTVPFKERLSLIKENKYDIALNTWSPKYRDPLAILDRFYYKDKKIDVFNQKEYQKLIDESKNSLNDRSKKLHEAEKMLLENIIVSPLYFSVENQYVNPKIKGILNIPIGNITDLSYAYIK